MTFNSKDYTDTKEVAGEAATGHTYGAPTWAWDGTSAKATFTCAASDDTQTVDATVTPAQTPATCTAPGKTVYTAKVTFEKKDYTDTKEVAGKAATGHTYGAPTWAWDGARAPRRRSPARRTTTRRPSTPLSAIP